MFSQEKFKRPILIYGAGVHLSGAENQALEYARRHRIPVCPTWAGLDLIPSDDPLCVGSFGTHGTRAGNFAIQNAGSIIAIGTRLDSKATGTPIESFARDAELIMVDIDPNEFKKFKSRENFHPVYMDALDWFEREMKDFPLDTDYSAWRERVDQWKRDYPVVLPEYEKEETVNPYVFIRELSKQAREGDIICTDTGCAVAWVSQAWIWKKGQRFIHAFNQTPMGYGLPAAVGAHYATGKRIILVTGDGSLMMALGELATAQDLPIKIFMFNNKGHGMCRQTQREWLGGTYPSTSIEGGLKFPQLGLKEVARSCGILGHVIEDSDFKNSKRETKRDSIAQVLENALSGESPNFTEVIISEEADVVPKVKYGYPNEEGHPLLSKEELNRQMIVPTWTAN